MRGLVRDGTWMAVALLFKNECGGQWKEPRSLQQWLAVLFVWMILLKVCCMLSQSAPSLESNHNNQSTDNNNNSGRGLKALSATMTTNLPIIIIIIIASETSKLCSPIALAPYYSFMPSINQQLFIKSAKKIVAHM